MIHGTAPATPRPPPPDPQLACKVFAGAQNCSANASSQKTRASAAVRLLYGPKPYALNLKTVGRGFCVWGFEFRDWGIGLRTYGLDSIPAQSP